MRLFEFDNQLSAAVKSNLIFLKNLNGDASKINMDALINLLKKQHILVTYEGLKRLFDADPALKNIVKDFNKEEIKLSDENEEPEVDSTQPSAEEQAQDDEKENIEDKVKAMADKGAKAGDKVDSMAKSAAKRRS